MGSLKGWVAQGPGQDCQGEEVQEGLGQGE